MVIRKLFKFEGAHIVRNCSSERCKFSLHGHSYVVECFFTSTGLDNGQMVMDFGLMKGTVKDIIDSFDHAYSMWEKEPEEFKSFIYANSARWIQMPVSPSAEAYSMMLFFIIDKIVNATEFNNGEKEVRLKSVRVHETTTGYAESFIEDMDNWNYGLEDIEFSHDIKIEWKDPDMYDKLIAYTKMEFIENDNLAYVKPDFDETEYRLILDLFHNGSYSLMFCQYVIKYLRENYLNTEAWADKDHSGPFDDAKEFAENNVDVSQWFRVIKPFINPIVEQQV